MDCREFESRLDLLETALVAPEERAKALEHASSCPSCRRLLAFVRSEKDLLEPDAGDDLALAILQRTSGTVCQEAEELLCDHVDGALGSEDEEILSLHLTHCRACSSLADNLAELAQALPDMAILEPDARFTEDVVRATAAVRAARVGFDWGVWWNQLISRPRFSWEAAYVGTLILLLALGNPAIAPATGKIPQMLMDQGDRLIRGTSGVLAGQRTAAEQSLDGLRLKSRTMWNTLAAIQAQTTSAMQREAAEMLRQLRSDLFGTTAAEQPKNDRR